jgi:putative hydrolase of the HAD superfamily
VAVKNVIFDLGGVLLEWSPATILQRCYPDPETQDVVRDALFRHEDWHAFNRGELAEAELIARTVERCGRTAADLTRVLDAVRDSLVEKPDTVEILRALHRRGTPLFCLSDMPMSVFSYVRQRYAFWSVFRGIVVSGDVGMRKPGRAIFEHLLSRYGLDAAETVFVDDLPRNVEGARVVGLDAILFSDAQQCRRDLRARLGISTL